jgi:hypothetical protein
MPGGEAAAIVTPPAAPAEAKAEAPKEEAPVLAPASPTQACATGPALSDEALLARASQGDAPSVSLTGTLRIATRTCDSKRCEGDSPRDLPVVIALTRTLDGGAWRGQISPTAELAFALEIGAAGNVRGELVGFGAASASAGVEGRATVTCLDAHATIATDANGTRTETTVSFLADVLAALPPPPVSEEPPAPSCDVATTTYPWQLVQNAGGHLTSQRAIVMEQYRDCRFATGCAPWKVAPVAADGTSPWTRALGAPFTPLELSSSSTPGPYSTVLTSVTRAGGPTVNVATVYPAFYWTSPVLGREASLSVKFTDAALFFVESGTANPEKTDPRVRSRRYACLPWTK